MPLVLAVLLTWFAGATVVGTVVGSALAFGNPTPAPVPVRRASAPIGG